MLALYSSNRFIQRPNLVVLHASITQVVGIPANSVDVFYLIVLKGILSSRVILSKRDHYKIFV